MHCQLAERFAAVLTISCSYSFSGVSEEAKEKPGIAITAPTLVIAILKIQSSYAKNEEKPAKEVPDTVQFFITKDKGWRIRTFAMDHDIHVYDLGDLGKMKGTPVDFAKENIRKHYGDILAPLEVIEMPDLKDEGTIKKVLEEKKLKPSFEVAKDGFIFWKPDDAKYTSQTKP